MKSRNSMTILATVLACASLALVTPCLAQWDLSYAWTEATERVSVFVSPDGEGRSFAEAHVYGAVEVDATITLQVYTDYGEPIVGYPAEDMWLETTLGGLAACAGGAIADGPTDASGQTFWLASPRAGGHTAPGAELLQVVINGSPLWTGPGFDIQFNSSDINGDLQVNLTDIALFTQILLGNYDYAADFWWDGTINLSDAVFLIQGNGVECP